MISFCENKYDRRKLFYHPSFQPYMSILDLLFYELPNALEIIRSGRKWIFMNPEVA